MATDTRRRRDPVRTAPDDPLDALRARRSRTLRRIGVAALFVIVGLAMSGVLGQRTSTVTASGGGYQLTVTYPSVVRPGLDVRWEVRVTKPGGFGPKLTLVFDRHYFDDFDLNSFRPDPDSSTSNGDQIIYSWDSPPGDTFQFSLDALVENGEHFGLNGMTAVAVNDARVATANYHTRWEP
ncbi:MAG: hypothetical protein ABR552_10190 [Actinomycetota bacterium]